MRIVWCSWKDRSHPAAGGAEVVSDELAKRLVLDGHEVIMLVGGYPGASHEDSRNGYKIIRVGGRITVYYRAWRYYRKHLQGWPDLVIDECNTIPFFAGWYSGAPTIMFFHMLCHNIWFYEMRFPFSLFGYLAEPIYLHMLRRSPVITVSESTKADLLRYGMDPDDIHIISEGIEIEPVTDLSKIEKFPDPTVLSLGSMRSMKRTLDQVKAFEIAKQRLPNLKMIVAGDTSGHYAHNVLKYIAHSPHEADIDVRGRVSKDVKTELMQRSHLLMVTSVKEGWGLVVTEAASQGTPSVVYDVDGLRDSVKHEQTGLISTQSTPIGLASVLAQALTDKQLYDNLRKTGWDWNKSVTFKQSYDDIKQILNI